MLRMFGLFAFLVLLLMVAPVALAQDETEEAPIVADVVDVAPDVVAVADGGNNSPTWYLLALGVVVFFATFAQYNLERMSGKSMRELSNSVPTHVVTLLLNGGSYLAKLTTTDADDKALIETGKRMGYTPSQLADGSIFWGAPASSLTGEDALEKVIDPIVKNRISQLVAQAAEMKKQGEAVAPNPNG